MTDNWDDLLTDEKVEQLHNSVQAIQNHLASWNSGLGQQVRNVSELSAEVQSLKYVLESLRQDTTSHTTHEQVISYIKEHISSIFPVFFQIYWQRQWNKMTRFVPGTYPQDRVLVNFTYARIRRYMSRYGKSSELPPESVGPYIYPDA